MMSKTVPVIVLGGTHSGSGKTTLAIGIAAALVRRGLRVQSFKVGPDYLDPGYLQRATGRPCYNLDGWMCGKTYTTELFNRAVQDADFAIVEGVMGLFDGASSVDIEGSTAEMALWLEAPVILIVPVHGMARSFAAIVKGFVEFDRRIKVTGIIANRCGSSRHTQLLSDALAAAALPPLLGGVPENGLPLLASRHLGLVSANSNNLPPETLASLADAVEEHISVARLVSQSGEKRTLFVQHSARSCTTLRIGIASDEAFQFIYPDFLDALTGNGAEIVRFSPLHDTTLPYDLDALYFCGGYPEVLAGELASNESMLHDVRLFAESGNVVYAECGGLMYLSRGIQALDGKHHDMCAVLPAWTRMLEKRSALGYREVTLTGTCILGVAGTVVRGHEFHYSELYEDPCEDNAWKNVFATKRSDGSIEGTAGYCNKNVLASYIHLHLPSHPEVLHALLAACSKRSSPQQLQGAV